MLDECLPSTLLGSPAAAQDTNAALETDDIQEILCYRLEVKETRQAVRIDQLQLRQLPALHSLGYKHVLSELA